MNLERYGRGVIGKQRLSLLLDAALRDFGDETGPSYPDWVWGASWNVHKRKEGLFVETSDYIVARFGDGSELKQCEAAEYVARLPDVLQAFGICAHVIADVLRFDPKAITSEQRDRLRGVLAVLDDFRQTRRSVELWKQPVAEPTP